MACWKFPRVHVMCLFPNRDLRSKEACDLYYICFFCWAVFQYYQRLTSWMCWSVRLPFWICLSTGTSRARKAFDCDSGFHGFHGREPLVVNWSMATEFDSSAWLWVEIISVKFNEHCYCTKNGTVSYQEFTSFVLLKNTAFDYPLVLANFGPCPQGWPYGQWLGG